MAGFLTGNPVVDTFGVLGNIISFIVFLAPLPTFYRIYKKKTTEGFQSIPYVVALFSAMMWLYYATLKSNMFLLITINSFGCVIEIIYIALYIFYAPKQARIFTLRLILLVNFGGFCFVLLLSHFLSSKGSLRAEVLGWLCTSFAVTVFAAPLSIIRVVIRTKSVEFMPFPLSFFLTLSAIMWLGYGLSLKDLCVAIPNVLGLIFGVLQMMLYFVYKNKTVNDLIEEQKIQNEQVKAENEKLDSIVLAEIQVISTETNNNNIDAIEKETEKENIPDNQNIVRPQTHHTCVINMDSPIINQTPTVRCEA